MKRFISTFAGFAAVLSVASFMLLGSCAPQEKTLVFLSTNDMHAKIQHFAQLAEAVEQCRDTTDMVILTDGGDRWTGNAYVDMADPSGRPIIELMNDLKFDVATLGNHEFDHGQAHLGKMLQMTEFKNVCCNVHTDTCTFPKMDPYWIMEKGGLKIGFIGAVTNYENNGYPAGQPESFVGISFSEPQTEVAKYAAELRPKCDMVVVISHMGDDRDAELLQNHPENIDLILGGHTHEQVNKVINGVQLTQAGKYMRNIGVTKVRFEGKTVKDITYEIIPLENYEPNAEYAAKVDAYLHNEELNAPVGELAEKVVKVGLANWMASSITAATQADFGFYHIGGVRLDGIEKGGVGTAKFFDLEPFGSKAVTVEMTTEAIRRMIVEKYNDKENAKEAHRVDLYSPMPYTILTDAEDEAVDVAFPCLKAGKTYKVALPDYVFKTYKALEYTNPVKTDIVVAKLLLENLKRDGKFVPDNEKHQKVEVKKLVNALPLLDVEAPALR